MKASWKRHLAKLRRSTYDFKDQAGHLQEHTGSIIEDLLKKHFEMRRQIQQFFDEHLGKLEVLIGFCALGFMLYNFGFYLNGEELIRVLDWERRLTTLYCVLILINLMRSQKKWRFIRKNLLESILLFAFIMLWILRFTIMPNISLAGYQDSGFLQTYVYGMQSLVAITTWSSLVRNRSVWLFVSANPTSTMVASFFTVILLGAGLLLMPAMTYGSISFVDALFTSTSAICVTGLSSFNIATVLTFKGQIVLLILIQVGGLGIITLTTFMALTVKKDVQFKEDFIIQGMLDADASSVTDVLRKIIYITLTLELVGAILLFFAWGDLGMKFGDLIFYSVFHSVSAFNNAGFSNFYYGLQDPVLSSHVPSIIIIMFIIITGGLGFSTYIDLSKNSSLNRSSQEKKTLSLQTRIILISTLVLIVLGTFFVWVAEYENWKDLSGGQQLLNALFTSVTCRTAGFSIVECGNLLPATIMIMILLMYIGGAPNSTAGGIKVTSFTVLFYAFWSMVDGRDHVDIGWNTIEQASVRRSLITFIVSIFVIFFGLLMLTYYEPDLSFLDLLFETISSIGTVGLTRGITPLLSDGSKLTLCVVMFSGKVGMISIVSLLGERKENFDYRYPEEHIMVG